MRAGIRLAGLLILLTAGLAHADRALLVGVGEYRHISNLPGIDLDIEIMRDLAPLLGYRQITVLQDDAATHANVRRELQALIEHVARGNRGLFYFSGHGAQIPDQDGDESDGRDEVLLLHDSDYDERKGRGERLLVDDELDTLYAQLDRGELLMIVDACHSGTVDKAVRGLGRVHDSTHFGSQQASIKSKGFLDIRTQSAGSGLRAKSDTPYMALMAADDHELALATGEGSVFTVGLREAVLQAPDTQALTLRYLHGATRDFIHANMGDRAFNPQLRGSPALHDKRIGERRATGGNGELWTKLENLVNRYGGNGMGLRVEPGNRIRIGEEFVLELELTRAGYVSLIAVDAGSESPVVLFPNAWQSENRFEAGRVRFPPSPQSEWLFAGTGEPSRTMIVALLTDEPLQMYAKGVRERGFDSTQMFAVLSAAGLYKAERVLRSVAVQERSSETDASAAADKVILDVVR